MKRPSSLFHQLVQRISADIAGRPVGMPLAIPMGDETAEILIPSAGRTFARRSAPAIRVQREALGPLQTLTWGPLPQAVFGSAWPRRVVAAALDSTRPIAISRR